MTSEEFRHTLSGLTKTEPGELHVQLGEVEALRSVYPHAIVLVRQTFEDDPRGWGHNCHAFAFGLIESEEFWTLTTADVWPDGGFVVAYLMPLMRERPDGRIVIYEYEDGRIAHSGLVLPNGFVRSKWGSTGHTWDHRLWEVPLGYGARVRYYEPPTAEQCIAAYAAFASDVAAGTKRGDKR